MLGYSDRMHELMQHQRSLHRQTRRPDHLRGARVRPADGDLLADSRTGGAQLAIICWRKAPAIRCNELTTLPFKIDRLLDDPARLAAMRRAATRMGRPHAARTVVETLLDDDLPPLALGAEQTEAIAQAASRELERMEEFLWGVATSAYQAEGGYNGPGQPQTNWAAAEARGDVASTGRAADFWNRYEEDFARCRALGLNAFRLGLEWSRDPARR